MPRSGGVRCRIRLGISPWYYQQMVHIQYLQQSIHSSLLSPIQILPKVSDCDQWCLELRSVDSVEMWFLEFLVFENFCFSYRFLIILHYPTSPSRSRSLFPYYWGISYSRVRYISAYDLSLRGVSVSLCPYDHSGCVRGVWHLCVGDHRVLPLDQYTAWVTPTVLDLLSCSIQDR